MNHTVHFRKSNEAEEGITTEEVEIKADSMSNFDCCTKGEELWRRRREGWAVPER
jgi:hypothetical protein